jgi:hypothetical protein
VSDSSACPKRRFGSRVSALLEVERINEKKGHLREHTPRGVYRCPACGGFHLTKVGQDGRARNR